MSYTKYRNTEEIDSTLSLLRDMWEANNHLPLCKMLQVIAQHKGIELKRMSDEQLRGYISDVLEGEFNK